ncbi:MAG: HD domain-containing protein [Lachnospiraceae bacterium]|nr:HD domain-containing protein [Lachnospiraceae bacterium]
MENKHRILVIEFSEVEFLEIRNILSERYEIQQMGFGEELFLLIKENEPDLILLDCETKELDWYQVVKRLKKDEIAAKIPIIFINRNAKEAEILKGFKLGCADYVRKPFEPDIMRSKIATQIELSDYRNHMEELLMREKRKVVKVTLEAIRAIAQAEEAKDSYTNAHSERVAEYAVCIAKKLGWKKEHIELLKNQALLHDIGKIGVPDSILNKHEPLTEEEYETMKLHVKIGNEILKNFAGEKLYVGALYHHEKWDGSGYFSGKKGEEIPVEARIITVADAYDAMTSERIYRGTMDEEKVKEELIKGSGTQFDPKIVKLMLEVIEEKSAFSKKKAKNH